MNSRIERFLPFTGIILSLVFATMWITSASIDGVWKFGTNTLSDLGISSNPAAAIIFNSACMLTAVIGLAMSYYRIRYEKSPFNRYGGYVLALSMVFLFLVGVFTKADATLPIHMFVSITYGILLLIGIILSVFGDRGYGQFPAIDAVMAVACVVFSIAFRRAEWEAVDIIICLVWIALQSFKAIYYRDVGQNGNSQ